MKEELAVIDQPQQTAVSVVNPMQLIQTAVESGRGIDELGKLLDLQERWEAGQAKKAFNEAMNKFQTLMPVVPKRGNVDYSTNKGRTSYDFGRLEDAAKLAKPILQETGLSYRFNQDNTNGSVTVTCIITHKDGYSESNSMTAPPDTSGNKDSIKAMASTVSYLRRYTFTAGLGIVFSGEDDEGVLSDLDFVTDEQYRELYMAMCDKEGRFTAKGQKIAAAFKITDLKAVESSKFEKIMKMVG